MKASIGCPQQTGTSQQRLDGLFHLKGARSADRRTGNENDVPATSHFSLAHPGRFTHNTFNPIPDNGSADMTAHGKTEAAVIEYVGESTEDDHRVRPGTAFLSDPSKVRAGT